MKNFFTVPQAAKICSVNSSTMHRWIASGKIKSYSTPGGHHRILIKDLKQWVEENNLPIEIDELKDKRSRILIVDDDTGVQNYLRKVLSGIFVDIDVASDGFEAGKKLIQFKPDLIILDLQMPNMDGFEVCKKVKEDASTRTIKILIMTGYGTRTNVDKALSMGADAVLSKPSSRKEILACVEKILK